MKAIVANFRLNSLYSITMPFTWQSALTYPILPPSAVIGMLANALQRYRDDKHPLEYLNQLENDIVWAGSRLLAPCIVRSYTTSAITKWQDSVGGKFTNVLGRQFAFARQLQVAAVFHKEQYLVELCRALMTTPLTCGDSESVAAVEEKPKIQDVQLVEGMDVVTTEFPVPYSIDTRIQSGHGQVLLMHTRCRKVDKKIPLDSYLVPVKEARRILTPSQVTIILTKEEKALRIEGVGYVIISA